MAAVEGRKTAVTEIDIKVVQDLIERCLQLYMSRSEVIHALLFRAKIDPSFTNLVWEKLEEQNRDFFRAYYLRLMVKNQIIEFNQLLGKQAKLLHQKKLSDVTSMSPAGSLMASLNWGHVPPYQTGYAERPMGSGSQSSMSCGAGMAAPIGAGRVANGMPNGLVMDDSYGGPSGCVFGASSACSLSNSSSSSSSSSGVAVSGSKKNADSYAQFVNDPSFLDVAASAIGHLDAIPRNFSLSDLTADFAQSSDILDNYHKLPPLAGHDNTYNSPSWDNGNMDHLSESESYDLGSE